MLSESRNIETTGPPAEKARDKPRWLMYRTLEGDLYFYDSEKNMSQWERPSGFSLQTAVNDPESWRAYRSADGSVYYYNNQTGEGTWDVRRETIGLKVVNDPSSWIAIRADDDRDELYYHNIASKETTWCKPPYIGEIEPINKNEKKKPEPEYKDTDGTEFVIPEDDFGSEEDDGDDDEVTEDKQELDYAQRQEEILERARKEQERLKRQEVILQEAREKHEKKSREEGFFQMLSEFDLKPYSQWVKWLPKFSRDIRFNRVPVEDRVPLFNRYIQGLSLKKSGEDTKTRMKKVRKIISRLQETDYGKTTFGNETSRKAKDVIATLSDFEISQDEIKMRNDILNLLQELNEKEKKKALKPLIQGS